MAKCKAIDCDAAAEKRGLCNAHYIRLRRHGDENAPRLRAPHGSGTKTSHGYRLVYDNGVQRYEHIVVAERAMGRPLPRGAEVHHANGIKDDNRTSNLVVCQSSAYHLLLHRRARALEASGNPDYRKCSYCGQWDAPQAMRIRPIGGSYHDACHTEYSRAWRDKQSENASETAASQTMSAVVA